MSNPLAPLRGLALAGLLLVTPVAARAAADPPLLVVLSDTGGVRDGLPVFTRHPEEARYRGVLERGFSGRLVRLYRWVQIRRAQRDGTPLEPAYLVLTDHQGGFPRTGFHLDAAVKRDARYVDLHRSWRLTGQFGSIDQIFPHELLHHLLRQLAGETPEGGANQVHAIGVRTDPYVAFDEGFAESAQVLAIDDPDAAPDTAALATDQDAVRRTEAQLTAYRHALTARWSAAARPRAAFVLWFSQAEGVMRYHAVKANRFAYEPAIPDRLLRPRRIYRAYLMQNILPGDAGDARKSPNRLRSSEGAVSALFARWLERPDVQSRYLDPAFYAPFSVEPGGVSPMENACLKLFDALERHKPHDVTGALRAYRDTFPEEAPAIADLARQIGFDAARPQPAEIWLANPGLMTGTTVFDQHRALPREHTFDLNAATVVDLMAVDGMTRDAASAILRSAPYSSLDDLERVSEVSAGLRARFARMAAGMTTLRAQTVEGAASLGLSSILLPYVWDALFWLIATAAIAALLYLSARPTRWWRAALNGVAAAFTGLAAAWLSDALGGTIAWILPVAAFGLPAALWQIARDGAPAPGARALAAWTLAGVAPFVITRSWF